jgi:hypothetical protein
LFLGVEGKEDACRIIKRLDLLVRLIVDEQLIYDADAQTVLIVGDQQILIRPKLISASGNDGAHDSQHQGSPKDDNSSAFPNLQIDSQKASCLCTDDVIRRRAYSRDSYQTLPA